MGNTEKSAVKDNDPAAECGWPGRSRQPPRESVRIPAAAAGCCPPLLRPESSLGRAGKVPDSSHAGAAVCLLVPGGLRLGRRGGLRRVRRQQERGGADPRHARQSDGYLGGDDGAAGGGRRWPGRRTPCRLPRAAIGLSRRRPAPGDRPCAVPAAGARRPARGLLRAGGLPGRTQQLQPRHPRAPVRGPEPGLRVHRAALQPAGRAAPAAPGRLRQLRGAGRQPLEVPPRPRRLAQRPALDRGPRRGGARGRGRPGPRRQHRQPGERQRGPPAGLLRGGAVRARALGAPSAGTGRAQEAAAGEGVQGGLSALPGGAESSRAPAHPSVPCCPSELSGIPFMCPKSLPPP